jgi:hypothetical protein
MAIYHHPKIVCICYTHTDIIDRLFVKELRKYVHVLVGHLCEVSYEILSVT